MFYKSLLCSLLFGVSLSAMEVGGSEGDSGGAGAGFGSGDDPQISIEDDTLYDELKEAKAKLKGKPLTQKVLDWSLRIYNVMYPKREEQKAAPPPPKFLPRGAPRGMPVGGATPPPVPVGGAAPPPFPVGGAAAAYPGAGTFPFPPVPVGGAAPPPFPVGGVPFPPVPVGGAGAYAGAVRPPLASYRNSFNFEPPSQRVEDFIKIIDFLNYAPSRFSTGDRLEVKDRVPIEDRASFVLSISQYIEKENIPNIFNSVNRVKLSRFKAFTSFIIDLFERKLEGTSYLFYLKVIYGMEDVPLGKMTEELKRAILSIPDSSETLLSMVQKTVKDFASFKPESLTDDFLSNYFNLRAIGIKPEAKSLDILTTINSAFLNEQFWGAFRGTKDKMRARYDFDDGLVQKALLFWGSANLSAFSDEDIRKLVAFINKKGFEMLDGISVPKAIFIINNFPFKDQYPRDEQELTETFRSMGGVRDDILISEFADSVNALKLKFESYADYSFAINALKNVEPSKFGNVLKKIDDILSLEKEAPSYIYNALYRALISVSSKHLLSFLNNASFVIESYPGVPAQDIICILSFVEPGKLHDVMVEINASPNPQELLVVLNTLWNKRNLMVPYPHRNLKEYRDDFEGERTPGFVYLTPELIRLFFLTFHAEDIGLYSSYSGDVLINSLDQLITKSQGKIQKKIDKFQDRVAAQRYPDLTEGLRPQEKIAFIKFLKTQPTISPTMVGYLADLTNGYDFHYRKQMISELLAIPRIEERLDEKIVNYTNILGTHSEDKTDLIKCFISLENPERLTDQVIEIVKGLKSYDFIKNIRSLTSIDPSFLTPQFIDYLRIFKNEYKEIPYAIELLKNLRQEDLNSENVGYFTPLMTMSLQQDIKTMTFLIRYPAIMTRWGESFRNLLMQSRDKKSEILNLIMRNKELISREILESVFKLSSQKSDDDKILFLNFFLKMGQERTQDLMTYLESFSNLKTEEQYNLQKAIVQLKSEFFDEPFLRLSKKLTERMKTQAIIETVQFLDTFGKEDLTVWASFVDDLIAGIAAVDSRVELIFSLVKLKIKDLNEALVSATNTLSQGMNWEYKRDMLIALQKRGLANLTTTITEQAQELHQTLYAQGKMEVINFLITLDHMKKNNWIENVKVLLQGKNPEDSANLLILTVRSDPWILKHRRLEEEDLTKIKDNIKVESIPQLLKNLEKCH